MFCKLKKVSLTALGTALVSTASYAADISASGSDMAGQDISASSSGMVGRDISVSEVSGGRGFQLLRA